MSTLSVVAWSFFSIAVLLRLSCGRFVRGGSKGNDDAKSAPPFASRWFGKSVVEAGALLSLVLLILAAGLLIAVNFGIGAGGSGS
jgi:hypothetical protein